MPSGLELYPHNEKAYRKLLDMLSGTRRACIIHPTGTGKAFIAYRYAFDHPNERILWMSPSTYIEQEQEASIRRELPNHEFKNIERMTYQTAMHRAQKGNLDIHADTVIFDEFHHTGAPQWSRGVEGVIECNPDANLIGLSATSIRYSDSGRDMSDGYGETRKEIVQKVGDAIRHGCPAFDMHWANRENFEERKEAYMEEKRLCARPVIELTTMREYADVHDALKFGSRYVDWKKIVAICDAKGEPTSEATRWRGERWFWKDDWNKNIKLKSGERIKDMQPVICYERGRCDYSVLELTRWHGFDHKSLLNSGKKGIVFDGLTWRLLRYDVDFEKRLKETPLICRETGKTFDTLSDLLDLLEREHECCAYDRPCHMYDLQRAIEGGREYKGFHFEYMVPPSVSGER